MLRSARERDWSARDKELLALKNWVVIASNSCFKHDFIMELIA